MWISITSGNFFWWGSCDLIESSNSYLGWGSFVSVSKVKNELWASDPQTGSVLQHRLHIYFWCFIHFIDHTLNAALLLHIESFWISSTTFILFKSVFSKMICCHILYYGQNILAVCVQSAWREGNNVPCSHKLQSPAGSALHWHVNIIIRMHISVPDMSGRTGHGKIFSCVNHITAITIHLSA